MIFHIYLLTNKVNGKIYVGQSKDFDQRWRHHKASVRNNKPTQIVHHAMIKYGLDNFIFEVIFSCQTQDDINWAEEYFIKYYDSRNTDKGYNITNGGSVAPKTEEWKQKVSQALMGHLVSQEARDKISIGNTGKIRSEEFKKNVGDFWRDKERSEEHCQNLSESLKGNQNCLVKQNGLGYRHTEEALQKISEASKKQPPRYKGKTWKIIDGKRVWINK